MFFKITWLLLLVKVNNMEMNVEVNPGIYLERLPNVTFYQSTQQVIFRVKRQQSILDRLNCRVTFCNRNNYICHQLFTSMNYFSNLQNITLIMEDDILLNDGDLFDFQLVTRNHLKRIFSSDYEINILINRFGRRDHVKLQELELPNLFIDDCNTTTCTDPKIKDLVLLELINQYETSRMIVNMCQVKRLPLDLVPLGMLEDILGKIRVDLIKNNYVIALSATAQFYMMPLVECLLSNQTILVGLHIPLLKEQVRGLHMMQILTPAFAWENYTCSVNLPVVNIALMQAMGTWKILIPKCDPIREELCFVSETRTEENPGSSCVQQVLRGGSFKQFATNCPLSCRETGNEIQFMTPISSHKVFVTHPKRSLRLECQNVTHTIQDSEGIGTISIDIPCYCHLQSEDDVIYPTYTCVDKSVTFRQHRLIPAAWTNYDGLSLPKWGNPALYFDTLQDCLNQKWIQQQFPESIIPSTTYFLIVLFILILILLISNIYLYRTFHSLLLPTRTTPTSPPSQTIIPKTTAITQTSPVRDRRRLPLPRLPEKVIETENDYLQPTELSQPIYTARVTEIPFSNLPSTSATLNVPQPHPDFQKNAKIKESEYVRMDQLTAMGRTKTNM